jgi:capsular exopolysaccharide synthesis family protein
MEKKNEIQVIETFNTIRTNIGFLGMDREMKVFLVTSAVKGEGKTTIACRIAESYASMKKKVLLVDCDLRNPSVNRELCIYRHRGLVDLILAEKGDRECADLSDFLVSVNAYLDVILSGQKPPNPLELLSSKRIEIIFKHLRQFYDIILLDSSPILIVSDAISLQRLADGILLVAKYGFTTAEMLKESKRQMEVAGVKPAACILNAVPGPKKRELYYGYYGYMDDSSMGKTRNTAGSGFVPERRKTDKSAAGRKTGDYFRQVR